MASYDRAITVFSPEGQLLQVQYAQEAVHKGSAIVGVRGPDVVVIAVETRVTPKLQDERTEKKIVPLDDHVVLAFAGLRADARAMINRTQAECQAHRLTVEDPPSIEYISRFMAQIKQRFTQSNGRRPFGLSCLVGGFDYDGSPHLFQTEPSGMFYEWKACSAGREEKTTREHLEKHYNTRKVSTDMGAITLAVESLLKVIKANPKKLDIAIMKRSQPVKMLDQNTINSYVAEIEKAKRDRNEKEIAIMKRSQPVKMLDQNTINSYVAEIEKAKRDRNEKEVFIRCS